MPTINNIQPGQTVQMAGNFPALGPGQNCCDIPWSAVCGSETFSGTDTVCVTTQSTSALSEMITCDSVRLQRACDYEALYFQYVDAIHNRVQTAWDNNFGSRGSPTANEMYFWKNPYESMAKMLVLAKEKDLTSHFDKYKSLLMDALTDIMPRMFIGSDAANTGSGSKYQNNGARTPTETRYNYLSISRALAFVGYSTFILRKCGALSAAEESFLAAQQPRLKIMADWLADQLPLICIGSHGGFAHMPLHLVVGMCFLEENGGYSYPQANTCLQTVVTYANNNGGSLGSDLSHDQDSLGNLMMIRDKQLCGSTNIIPFVSSDFIAMVGDNEAQKISSGAGCQGGLCGSLPDHIGVHALAIGCSSAIDSLVPEPVASNFPAFNNPNSYTNIEYLNQVQTLVDAAAGYMQRKDGEVC